MSSRSAVTFWRPGAERPPPASAHDRCDVDPLSSTAFVAGGGRRSSHDELQRQRRRLPVFGERTRILHALDRSRVLVLVGETGSGKSTQLPQYCHEAGWTRHGRRVAVVQPRRVAATSLAARVADEMGCRLGDTVGYRVRFDECAGAATLIHFMTDGVLLREMMADPLLRAYAVVMVDEVHERSLATDMCLALLRKIVRRRRADLRLIVCSATVDAERLAEFFDIGGARADEQEKVGVVGGQQDVEELLSAVVLTVPGRQYPVDVFYSSEPVADYVSASVRVTLDIHRQQPDGDVLVFLTGQEEVDEAVQQLTHECEQHTATASKGKLLALPMYGSLATADQRRVFERAPSGCRKVVVATNIAEASITIPGVVYVVDCGFVKRRWLSPADGHTSSLVVCATSQAAARQRTGRAGRERSGQAYRLYTRTAFDQLPAECVPEIRRAPLAGWLLQLRALGVQNVARLALPSPPPARSVLLAAQLLYALGAVELDCQLTPLGRRMAELPLAPTHARLLLCGEQYECGGQMASLVAMMQVERCWAGASAAAAARAAHRAFHTAEGDALTYLNVYGAFVRSGRSRQWCRKMYVNHSAMIRVCEIRQQTVRLLRKLGVNIDDDDEDGGADGRSVRPRTRRDDESLLKCIASGLFANAAYWHHSGQYRCARSHAPLAIHSSSVLYGAAEPPNWLVYGEMVHGAARTHIKDVTVVSPEWLLEVAPHYYHVTGVSDK